MGSILFIKKTAKLCEDLTKIYIPLDRRYGTLEVKLQNKIVKRRRGILIRLGLMPGTLERISNVLHSYSSKYW